MIGLAASFSDAILAIHILAAVIGFWGAVRVPHRLPGRRQDGPPRDALVSPDAGAVWPLPGCPRAGGDSHRRHLSGLNVRATRRARASCAAETGDGRGGAPRLVRVDAARVGGRCERSPTSSIGARASTAAPSRRTTRAVARARGERRRSADRSQPITGSTDRVARAHVRRALPARYGPRRLIPLTLADPDTRPRSTSCCRSIHERPRRGSTSG
jgi:hypothetical protein